MVEPPTTLTNKPNTQVKECYLYMYINHFLLQNGELSLKVQWSKIHFPIFLLPKPKVSIYSVSVH